MNKHMRIVIFEGSLQTTTFINRLISGLSESHTIAVFGFNENLVSPIKGVKYVALGSASNLFRLLYLSVRFAFSALFRLRDLALFFRVFKNIFFRKKEILQQLNFEIATRIFHPDIMHLQWPSLLPWCENLIDTKKCKIVLSQRGYQNNVRPFVDEKALLYLKKMYPKIDGFHSVSHAISKAGDIIYYAPNKIDTVIYSGFHFDTLPFQQEYIRNETLEILSIGRPHWVKGYADALLACKLLKEQGQKFMYTIVGAKQNEELQYKIQEYGLLNHILLTDKVPQKKVYEMMRTKDLLLFPSIIEGLPNVVVEAMAVGLPVLATESGGIPELLDETTGFLVPSRNATAIAKAVQAFVVTPIETINSIRMNARKKVAKQHTTKRMVSGMEALYFKVVSSNS